MQIFFSNTYTYTTYYKLFSFQSNLHLRLQTGFYSTKICTVVLLQINFHSVHSSEIRGLRLMKLPSEMLQNLLYFMYKKTHVVLFVFHFMQLYFFPYECHGLCRHSAFIWEKVKLHEMKNVKKLRGFSYT